MSVNPSFVNTAETAASDEAGFFRLKVRQKKLLAKDIYLFELCHEEGTALPAFTAGAHVTVETPCGVSRNYSLCSDPAETGMYQIAVKRDAAGRGGSISMVADVLEGDWLSVSGPRNNFELNPRASNFLFIAGGIGITPIMSMMRHLKAQGNDQFKLIYCTRDAESTAFLAELKGAQFGAHVEVHHDLGDLNNAVDLWPIFETPTSAQVYCCGPRGLMDAVADTSGHWPSNSVHFESFGVDARSNAPNTAFTVHLQQTGTTLQVAANQSILEALRASGLRVASSCESGTCGSCRTSLLSGSAEHRDMVLSEEEKESNIMVCVSRAKSAALVLDL